MAAVPVTAADLRALRRELERRLHTARTVAVLTAPEQSVVLKEAQTLDGGDVLPGFRLPLRDLFAELDRHASA